MKPEWQNEGAKRFALGPETWTELGALLEASDVGGVAELFELPAPEQANNRGEREYVFFTADGPDTLTEKELVNRYKDYEQALRRLASTQTFTVAFDARAVSPETLWRELRARGEYAEGVLSGAVLP